MSSAKSEEAMDDMVAQVAARVIAAMREENLAQSTQNSVTAPTAPRLDGDMVEQARHTAGGVVGAVKEQAVSRLDKQKEHAVAELASVAGTVRQMGDQLKAPEHGAVAQYAAQYGDMAADQLQHLSGYLRQHDVKQLVREVEGFARREPLLFTGGAFILGLIGARFLKSKPVTEEIAPIPAPRVSPEAIVLFDDTLTAPPPIVSPDVSPAVSTATAEREITITVDNDADDLATDDMATDALATDDLATDNIVAADPLFDDLEAGLGAGVPEAARTTGTSQL
ncbi:MAG TPA: hypothetical protein VF627_10920 [Abditibacterium sp.]